ncbi:unnamed protein product [Arctia plantaginis]|uniref:HAT C-terminal dimerisation domain-containing protein n=2 Tax=Arctia plantaginis TaxID=874455 RepID=A0A8S0YSA0_ARCPL|nr:unnamed protein product [Arctia plantaginis]
MKAAWRIIKSEFPHIFCVGCPLATAILSTERDTSVLSDVYYTFENLKKGLSQVLDESVFLDAEDKNLLLGHVSSRKDFCMQSIHFAAYLLDPRHCGNGLSDEDISKATEFIQEYCVTSGLDVTNVLTNMAEFKTKTNFFQESKPIWSPAKKLQPRIWWQTFTLNQSVGAIAIKILSVPPSSAASERNWSMFAHTHTKLRNRLKQSRVLKLISIRSNLNLLKKKDEKILYNDSEDEDSEDGEIEHVTTSNTDPLV